MTILYILLGIAVGLGILVAVLSQLAPKETRVSRSILVNLSQEEAFDHLKSLKKSLEWSPWAERDPNQTVTFKGTDGEVGSSYHWSGNKQVGEGEQEVTNLVAPSRVDTHLRFIKPFKSESKAHFAILPHESGQTEITWGFHSHNTFPGKIFMLFMNMDKVLGGDFEKGLSQFKEKYERA